MYDDKRLQERTKEKKKKSCSFEDNRCVAKTEVLLHDTDGLVLDQLVHLRRVVPKPSLGIRIACLHTSQVQKASKTRSIS